MHDKIAHEIFNRDGVQRDVVRGPASLFYLDTEGVDPQYLLEYEVKGFTSLIEKINH